MLGDSAVDWWDSSEETACDRTDWPTGQGLLRPLSTFGLASKLGQTGQTRAQALFWGCTVY